jgi:hypothetical protein
MSDPKLFISLSTTHGVMQTQFLPGVMDLFRDRTYDTMINQIVDPYIVLGRNTAASDFLASDADILGLIDADIVFTAHHVKTIVSRDEDIVGGLYPKKAQGKIQWVCNALPHRPAPDARGLIELKHVGTGFMWIKRRVFEKMIEAFGDEITYYEAEIDKLRYDFFDMPRQLDCGKIRKISEDWHFCNKARELGFKVYGDTRVILRHIGTAVFPLETQVVESRRERNYGLARD